MKNLSSFAKIAVIVMCAAVLALSCDDKGGGGEVSKVEFFKDLGYGAVAANGTGPIAVQSGWTRYEAESAVIFGSSRLSDTPIGTESNSFWSGGKSAGGMNKNEITVSEVYPDWTNIAYVKFTVNVTQAGNYGINILYNGNDDKDMLVRLNDEQVVVQFPRQDGDHQWNSLFTRQIAIGPFKAGSNEIWVSGVIDKGPHGNGWANIDCIDVQDTLYVE